MNCQICQKPSAIVHVTEVSTQVDPNGEVKSQPTGEKHFCTGADLRAGGVAMPEKPESAPDRIAGDGSRAIRTGIQRLIGRSLRAVVDLKALGERQIRLDCDVIQADGGTRTAGITGAWVALRIAIARIGPHWPRNNAHIGDAVGAGVD